MLPSQIIEQLVQHLREHSLLTEGCTNAYIQIHITEFFLDNNISIAKKEDENV